MKNLYCLLPFLFGFVIPPVNAQIGREFWFAAPEVTSQHADNPVRLVVSSLEKAVDVAISQPANPAFKPINVSLSANTTRSIDLSSWLNLIETKPADVIVNTGLFIKATQDISIYYEVDGTNL